MTQVHPGDTRRPRSPLDLAKVRHNWTTRTQRLPLCLVLAFFGGTFALYLSRIFVETPPANDLQLAVLVFLLLSGLTGGYHFGLRYRLTPVQDPKLARAASVGMLFSLLLFIPSVRAYTGQSLGSFFALLVSPSDAIRQLQLTVVGTREDRLGFLILKAIASPFVIASIPFYSYQYFSARKHGVRLLILCALMFSLSVFRGTDKELVDVFLILCSTYLIVSAQRGRSPLLPSFRTTVAVSAALLLVLGAFVLRKADRIGALAIRCFPGTQICQDLTVLGDNSVVSLGLATLAWYLTQGFYGLGLALDLDFSPGFGFGHSRPLRYLGERVFGIDFSSLLTEQLTAIGWNSRSFWPTGVAWLANDIPMILTPLAFATFGFLLAVSWKEAVLTEAFLPKLIFTYTFFALMYMPANLQLAQSGDLYVGFLFWLSLYVLRMIRQPVSARSP